MENAKLFSLFGWILILGSVAGCISFMTFQYGILVHQLALLSIGLLITAGVILVLPESNWKDYLIIGLGVTFMVLLQWR